MRLEPVLDPEGAKSSSDSSWEFSLCSASVRWGTKFAAARWAT